MTVHIFTQNTLRTQYRPPTPTSAEMLRHAANECASWSSKLLFALNMDPSKTPNDCAVLAFKAAHYGRIVLAAIASARQCERCSDALVTPTDKLTGYCVACREDARALRLMRGGRA